MVFNRTTENSFGEKLKGLRAKAGLTQESLAKDFDVSRTLITKWETGKADPTESSLERIAEYFGVEKGYLVDDEEVRKIALETSHRQRIGYKAADFTILISASCCGERAETPKHLFGRNSSKISESKIPISNIRPKDLKRLRTNLGSTSEMIRIRRRFDACSPVPSLAKMLRGTEAAPR